MAESLAERKCVPCRGGTPPLTRAAITPLLAQVEGWTVEEDKRLTKAFKFKDFVQAVDFVNGVARVAEEEQHHPDLYVRWGEVRANLWTHKIDGLTESDFFMAAKMDKVYAHYPPAG